MESGVIMLYLAETYGNFLSLQKKERYKCMEWLNFQTASQGPMLGQAHHFLKFNKGKSEYSEKRYHEEAKRLYKVIDKQLKSNKFLAGSEYTIADIATWPWIARHEWHDIGLAKHSNLCRWYLEISKRTAVVKGYKFMDKNLEISLP